ncbi:MAG TPA: STAS domain-containing protein [Thermoanaerobaculia bacterium]|nr:STAS domain-containing protein [Thermoanaerobaculia bacterium]
MEMREERRGDALIVTPVGRLDTNTSDEFHAHLTSRLDGGVRKLVIDMSAIDYVSSAGLRVFLLAAKKLNDTGGKLALGGLNPSVRQVFSLSGLLAIFAVEPDAEKALARVTSG